MIHNSSSVTLTSQLCKIETLDAAWRKVRKNKGGPGSDGITIQQFEAQLNKHLRQLARELTEDRYYPLPVQKFTMQRTNGNIREISVLALKDRIIQRAVCDLITPIYEAKFLDCSFGYRPNRGVPQAVAQVNAIRAEGYEWVVDADIENFFDTMDNRILMRFLRTTIKEVSCHKWFPKDNAIYNKTLLSAHSVSSASSVVQTTNPRNPFSRQQTTPKNPLIRAFRAIRVIRCSDN